MKYVFWIASGLLGICFSANADVSPEDEFEKRLKLAQTLQPMGDSPFGETLNMFTGELGFRVDDIVVDGNGPRIVLARTALKQGRMRGFDPGLLGDWDLSIPRIETLVQAVSRFETGAPGEQWKIAEGNYSRCTQFREPYNAWDTWWNGYEFIDGDGHRQQMLVRDPANTARPGLVGAGGQPIAFPVVTNQNWQIGCLPNTSNGQLGEGFLAVSPDGTKYFLDHLVGVRAENVVEILPDPVGGAMAPPPRLWYPRLFATMYVSRIEDRFGNSLAFSYSGRQISSIVGSDGRRVDFVWRSDVPVIDSIVIQAGSQQRTWHYEYADVVNDSSVGWKARLSRVTLPDGTSWVYSAMRSERTLYNPNICDVRGGLTETEAPNTYQVTHPSGLVGSFTTLPKWHARSYVPTACDNPGGGATLREYIPLFIAQESLVSKSINGPGLAAMTWSYGYSAPQPSAMRDTCASSQSCPDSRWVDVTGPEGDRTRYTVSTRWGVSEGKVLKAEVFEGSTSLLSTTTTSYAAPNTGPFPAKLGAMLGASLGTNVDISERWSPTKETVIGQQGRVFKTTVNNFDGYARPISVTKSSAPSP